jgi:sulfofructose kinase
VDSSPDTYLSIHAAVNVVSKEFLLRTFPGRATEEMPDSYLLRSPGLVILTAGAAEILYARRSGSVRHVRPFRVKAPDTTGAGDAFRAGMVLGLLRGWDDEEAIRYASAVAALVCLSSPGILRSPTRRQVAGFLKTH